MLCLEYYYIRDLLIGGFPLKEASEQDIHYGNKSSFLLFLLHDLAYIWSFYVNLDIMCYNPPIVTQNEMHSTFTKIEFVSHTWHAFYLYQDVYCIF